MIRRFGRIGRNMLLGLAATGIVMAGSAISAQAKAPAKETKAQTKARAAANKMLSGLSAGEIISILTEHKIQAQKLQPLGNDPVVLAQLQSGAKFFVRLRGCAAKGVKCQIIQYGAIFTGANLPATDFNTFNARTIFGKAYEGPQKEMHIEHSVSVAGGIRRGAVETNMFVFFQMANLFTRFLQERLSSVSASLDHPAGVKSGAITNAGGKLPNISSLASLHEAVAKHPEIINKVRKGKLTKWTVN